MPPRKWSPLEENRVLTHSTHTHTFEKEVGKEKGRFFSCPSPECSCVRAPRLCVSECVCERVCLCDDGEEGNEGGGGGSPVEPETSSRSLEPVWDPVFPEGIDFVDNNKPEQ